MEDTEHKRQKVEDQIDSVPQTSSAQNEEAEDKGRECALSFATRPFQTSAHTLTKSKYQLLTHARSLAKAGIHVSMLVCMHSFANNKFAKP